MPAPEFPVIRCLPGEGPPRGLTVDIVFVGGPRVGSQAHVRNPAATIEDQRGIYRRTVACSDDGRLRYVWRPNALHHAVDTA
jgi:hypothetical protein